jgi:hypothetical protein
MARTIASRFERSAEFVAQRADPERVAHRPAGHAARSSTRIDTPRARADVPGMNAAWHDEHRLARNASEAERIAWHVAHQKACACRPIPRTLADRIGKLAFKVDTRVKTETTTATKIAKTAKTAKTTKTAKAAPSLAVPDTEFGAIVRALSKERGVTFGGKGFGSAALKVDDKIFAMTSSKGDFVVKLPRARVEELVRKKQGKYFDAGRGRLMREWLSATGPSKTWLALAVEALEFGRGA